MRGVVQSADKAKITLKSRNGSTDYALADDVAVMIDGKPAKIDDIKTDMLVLLDRKEEGAPVNIVKIEGPTIGGEVKVDVRSMSS